MQFVSLPNRVDQTIHKFVTCHIQKDKASTGKKVEVGDYSEDESNLPKTPPPAVDPARLLFPLPLPGSHGKLGSPYVMPPAMQLPL